jgi:hypothetical protein
MPIFRHLLKPIYYVAMLKMKRITEYYIIMLYDLVPGWVFRNSVAWSANSLSLSLCLSVSLSLSLSLLSVFVAKQWARLQAYHGHRLICVAQMLPCRWPLRPSPSAQVIHPRCYRVRGRV